MPRAPARQHHEADHRVDQQLAPRGGEEVWVELDRHPPRRGATRRASRPPLSPATPAEPLCATRTQPSGCTSNEIHTAAGTTVDEGQYRPTRSTCSTPFLKRAHHCVLVAQPRQPRACLLVLRVLDGRRTPRPPDRLLGRDRCARDPGQHDRIVVVGPDLDRFRAVVCPHSKTL